jgi:hypothetical protein
VTVLFVRCLVLHVGRATHLTRLQSECDRVFVSHLARDQVKLEVTWPVCLAGSCPLVVQCEPWRHSHFGAVFVAGLSLVADANQSCLSDVTGLSPRFLELIDVRMHDLQ